MRLLLIGAGQIGSRHLQSCLKFNHKLEIYVVDPAQESLDIATSRAAEINNEVGHQVHYVTDFAQVDGSNFDYLILATGASVRAKILTTVLDAFEIKHAILEKVLFQDLAAYDNASKLLEQKNVNTFVNCPLRAYPFFKQIKSQFFTPENKTQFSYCGGDWVGMACNVIHYLDLVNFLTDEALQDIDTQQLDDGYIDSKRAGSVEFTGLMSATYERGSSLSFRSIRDSGDDSVMVITHGQYRFIIDELSGKYKIYDNDKLIEDSQYQVVYQSDLSHKMLGQLLESGCCELNNFNTSMQIHKVFISSFLGYYNQFTDNQSLILPVT